MSRPKILATKARQPQRGNTAGDTTRSASPSSTYSASAELRKANVRLQKQVLKQKRQLQAIRVERRELVNSVEDQVKEFLAHHNMSDSMSLHGSRSMSLRSTLGTQTAHTQLEELEQRNVELAFQLIVLQHKHEKSENNEAKYKQMDHALQLPLFDNPTDHETLTQLEQLELVHQLELIREELNLMSTASTSDLSESSKRWMLKLRNHTDRVLVELKREADRVEKHITDIYHQLQTIRNGLKDLIVDADYLSEAIVRQISRVQRELTLAQKWTVSSKTALRSAESFKLQTPELLVADQAHDQEIFHQNKNKLESRIAELENNLDELQAQINHHYSERSGQDSECHSPKLPAKSKENFNLLEKLNHCWC